MSLNGNENSRRIISETTLDCSRANGYDECVGITVELTNTGGFWTKKEAVPFGTAKFREETSKMQRAEAAPHPQPSMTGRAAQAFFCIAAFLLW
jgi:hypothetical protein